MENQPFDSNSDHQDDYIFSRGSQPKPSFATIASWEGGHTQAMLNFGRVSHF